MSRTGNLTNQTPRMRVLRMIRTNIDSGNWKPGEKIPTEQQLARELRTSRETVRAALAQAEAEGLIINLRKQGGRGRVVAEPHQKVEDSLLGCVIVLITGYRRPVGVHESGGNEHLLNAGVYECAQQHDFHVLSVYGHSLNERKLDQLIDARPFGVIADVAMSSHPNIDRYLHRLPDFDCPVVFSADEDVLAGTDRVCVDFTAGADAQLRWLAGQGCQRIVFLAPRIIEPAWLRQRREGYTRAAAETGCQLTTLYFEKIIPQQPNRESFDFHVFKWHQRLPEILSYKPDALILTTDSEVAPLSAALRMHQIQPNDDILIAGFDNYWSTWPARQFEPVSPVVTVDKHNLEIGHELVRLLIQRRLGQVPPDQPQLRLFRPTLIFPAQEEA